MEAAENLDVFTTIILDHGEISNFINTFQLLFHLLHRLEERLAIVLECHDELQLRASRFHCYRENKSGAKHSS